MGSSIIIKIIIKNGIKIEMDGNKIYIHTLRVESKILQVLRQ